MVPRVDQKNVWEDVNRHVILIIVQVLYPKMTICMWEAVEEVYIIKLNKMITKAATISMAGKTRHDGQQKQKTKLKTIYPHQQQISIN